MGGIHVGELAADDFADAADVDWGAIGSGDLGFFAEKHIVARDANGLAAELTDHAHEVRVDFLREHAGDDIDRLVGRDAKAADKFCFKSGLFHRGGN